MARSESVWEALVRDAKCRGCFFNAEDDKDLAKVILAVKNELDQLEEVLNPGSILFRNQMWKVNNCYFSLLLFVLIQVSN